MPIILTGIAIAFFFVVTNPMYSGANGITALQAQINSYNQALDTSTQLQKERDQLTATYNSIDPDNLAKLQTLLPDDINNIRLILEIQQIASTYGMQLSDVKYDSNTPTAATGTAAASGGGAITQPASQTQGYGTFNLGFSTSGTYDNFIAFTKSLESNLRIVDISSISFSSATATTTGPKSATSSPSYTYDFNIQTYWLNS